MDYLNFKLLHLTGILFLFSGIGGMVFMSYFAPVAPAPAKVPGAKVPRILHGLGLLLVLVGGVMMVYSLKLDGPQGVPLWIKLKMMIFILLGGLIALLRQPKTKRWVLPIAIVLGMAASYLALFKPV